MAETDFTPMFRILFPTIEKSERSQNLKWAGLFAIVVALTVCGAEGRGAAADENPSDRIPNASSPAAIAARIEAFRQGLRELGYVEGKNIVIEYRYAEGKRSRA